MRRLTLCILLLLFLAPVAMAARTPLKVISRDPYISALVIDAESGNTLFEENADTQVYPASVLKLMDLYVILDLIEHGALQLDEMVQVTPEAARIGGSQVYLDPREQFSVEDLLYALMVQSANDAATALAIHVSGSKKSFIALMNQKAQELGMKHTRFHSVHGLPPSNGQSPDVTTARDLAILCRALTKRPEALKYTATRTKGFREDKFIMRNHNKLLKRVSGCDGLKTGFYYAAGFSIAATAQKNGTRVIALVMGSKYSKIRDKKAAELLAKGFTLAQLQPKPAAVINTATPPDSDGAAQQGQVDTDKSPAQESGRGKFFTVVMGAGFLFFLAFFVAVGMRKKSHRRIFRSKRKKLF